MNITHLTPHMGGGVGAVIRNWVERTCHLSQSIVHNHRILCLEYVNKLTIEWAKLKKVMVVGDIAMNELEYYLADTDILVIHFWDHPKLLELMGKGLPIPYQYKIVLWCHKNTQYNEGVFYFGDAFVTTSTVILERYGLPTGWVKFRNRMILIRNIRSVANMDRFQAVERSQRVKTFGIGYVGTIDYKKIHPDFLEMTHNFKYKYARFYFLGDVNVDIPEKIKQDERFVFLGIQDDVAHYLSLMDVFGYPLRHDHYGTSEQVLGEAMHAGVVPVVMANDAEGYTVQSTVNGLLAYNQDDYTYKLELLYRHPEYLRKMSRAARATAKEMYSSQRMIEEWEELFKEVTTNA